MCRPLVQSQSVLLGVSLAAVALEGLHSGVGSTMGLQRHILLAERNITDTESIFNFAIGISIGQPDLKRKKKSKRFIASSDICGMSEHIYFKSISINLMSCE